MIETYKYLHGIYEVDRMPLVGQQYGNQGTQLEAHEGTRDCKTTKELLHA